MVGMHFLYNLWLYDFKYFEIAFIFSGLLYLIVANGNLIINKLSELFYYWRMLKFFNLN